MKSLSKKIAVITLLLSVNKYYSQSPEKKQLDTRFNIVFGLTQPTIAKGYNAEVNFFYKRIAFDYSHGASLDFSGSTVTGELATQKLAVHMPWTTGFGIGYRFTEMFNLRVEPKWHRFQIFYDGQQQTSENKIVDYTTFSLGLGAYFNWLPFKNKTNALNGIVIAPSVRYWPRIFSTLDNNKFNYFNTQLEQNVTHKAMEAGIANSPIIFNISIGYSFKLNKKK